MSAGIMCEDLGQICKDARARAAVLADMDVVAQEAQLRKFEYAKAVTLVLEPFTLENGLLTPTFKVMCNILFVHYNVQKISQYHFFRTTCKQDYRKVLFSGRRTKVLTNAFSGSRGLKQRNTFPKQFQTCMQNLMHLI